MKIPLYWTRSDVEFLNADGKKCWLDCWGWSDVSQQDAARHAQERAEKAIEHHLKRAVPYDYRAYSDLPLREELVQDFHNTEGKRHAAITRNAIGCWVLNTTSLPFVDVDGPIPDREGLFAMLTRLLRGQEREPDLWYRRTPQRAT